MAKVWVEVEEDDIEVAISAVEKLADKPIVDAVEWVSFHRKVATRLREALGFAKSNR